MAEELFNDKDLIAQSPILPLLKKALSVAQPRPETPYYAQISNVLQTYLSSILTGELEVVEAMEIAQRKTKEIIASSVIEK